MTDLMPEPERRNYRSRKIYGPSFWQIFTAAVDSIRYLGRRAVLALTGIAAGSAIVVALINIGNMAQLESANVFQGMGGDILMSNFQPAPGRPVTGFMPGDIDMALLVSSLDASVKAAGIVMTASELPSGQSRMPVVLIGQSGNLEDIMGLKLQHGRFLTRTDASSTYVLIGSELARGRHIGEQIRLGEYIYTIIGILAHRGNNPLFPFDPDNAVFLNDVGMKRIMPSPYLTMLIVKYRQASSQKMADQLQHILHSFRPDIDINVQLPETLIDGMDQQSRLFGWLLICMGCIGLLTGGVGIMNVMLMNIIERRKEIGIRLAIGARTKDIALQFLLESVLLSAVGAIAGCVTGVAGALLFFEFAGWSTLEITASSLLLGAGSSLLSGLLFGFYPAIRAAQTEPVRAMNDA